MELLLSSPSLSEDGSITFIGTVFGAWKEFCYLESCLVGRPLFLFSLTTPSSNFTSAFILFFFGLLEIFVDDFFLMVFLLFFELFDLISSFYPLLSRSIWSSFSSISSFSENSSSSKLSSLSEASAGNFFFLLGYFITFGIFLLAGGGGADLHATRLTFCETG